MGMPRALALVPSDRGPRWCSFRDPLAVHRAWSLEEVAGVVAAAEEATAGGRWVVLVLAYDAAPAFEPAMVAARHHRAPLAVAGVFAAPEPAPGPRPGRYRLGRWAATMDETAHGTAVERSRSAIAAGDVYQVNLTLRLKAAFGGDPEGLFAAMFRAQGGPYAAYVELDDGVICSASPELLLARRGDRLITRPMKGTAGAVADPDDDRAAVAGLRSSPKERAENTMIVDVARNDLGRIARLGSVAVDRLWAVEHYPTVHQLTSVVRADSDASLAAALGAVFPAASITGAPKIEATRLIHQLEGSGRGVYCGTVGVLSPTGWQLNVAIRTAWVDRDEGSVEYGVGGGIVWDSTPAAEWAEVAAKAAVVGAGARSAPYWLLETMRWEPATGLQALDRHRSRLLASGRALGFDVEEAAVDAALVPLRAPAGGSEAAVDPRRIRLLVDAAGRCEVEEQPAPPWGTVDEPAGPWRATLAAEPVRADDLFLRHKTTHRTTYRVAADGSDGDEVILWNEDGHLTETTVGNLVVELDGRLVTPPEGAGLLPGTMRAHLLDTGRIAEADLTVDDLARATRLWTVNAVRGWVDLVLQENPPPPARCRPTGPAEEPAAGAVDRAADGAVEGPAEGPVDGPVERG